MICERDRSAGLGRRGGRRRRRRSEWYHWLSASLCGRKGEHVEQSMARAGRCRHPAGDPSVPVGGPVLAAAWMLLPGVGVPAQEPQAPRTGQADGSATAASGDADARLQTPVFRSGINFVRVDAIVTDDDGNPILDLTEDDFRVFEDEVEQTIESFRLVEVTGEPDPALPPPPASATSTTRSARRRGRTRASSCSSSTTTTCGTPTPCGCGRPSSSSSRRSSSRPISSGSCTR